MANVVITGANRGIGLELVKHYRAQGDEVYGLCRHSSDELNQSGAKIIDKVDIGNPDALPDSLARIKDVKIDLLINNAGVLARETLENWDSHTVEHQFRVNSLGPIVVTHCLLSQLRKNAKIAMITSRMGSMADNTSGGYYGYRMSKAALNAASVSLAEDLKHLDIAVGILHPGYVQTEMVSFGGDISAETAAQNLAKRIEELNMQNTGTFWHANGDVLPW